MHTYSPIPLLANSRLFRVCLLVFLLSPLQRGAFMVLYPVTSFWVPHWFLSCTYVTISLRLMSPYTSLLFALVLVLRQHNSPSCLTDLLHGACVLHGNIKDAHMDICTSTNDISDTTLVLERQARQNVFGSNVMYTRLNSHGEIIGLLHYPNDMPQLSWRNLTYGCS